MLGCRSAEHGTASGHDQRGRDTFVCHIADDNTEPTLPQVDEVVKVTTDGASRSVEGVNTPASYRRQLLGKQGLLDKGGDLKLLVDPFPLLRLDLLLSH